MNGGLKNKNLSFTVFEIQFKIRDLRLYYSTAQLVRVKSNVFSINLWNQRKRKHVTKIM